MWRDGYRTLHGLTSVGFPNCFFLGFVQSAITVSVPQALNEQARHITYLFSEALKRGHGTLEPTVEVQEAFVQDVRNTARLGIRFYQECTPGYYNSDRAAGSRSGFHTDMYGGGSIKFFQIPEAWRKDGRMEGLALA